MSFHNDAANYGIGIASTAVAFIIFGITAKIKKYKYFFLITGFACVWGMFPSGTRTGIACLMAGIMVYNFAVDEKHTLVQCGYADTISILYQHCDTNIGRLS